MACSELCSNSHRELCSNSHREAVQVELCSNSHREAVQVEGTNWKKLDIWPKIVVASSSNSSVRKMNPRVDLPYSSQCYYQKIKEQAHILTVYYRHRIYLTKIELHACDNVRNIVLKTADGNIELYRTEFQEKQDKIIITFGQNPGDAPYAFFNDPLGLYNMIPVEVEHLIIELIPNIPYSDTVSSSTGEARAKELAELATPISSAVLVIFHIDFNQELSKQLLEQIRQTNTFYIGDMKVGIIKGKYKMIDAHYGEKKRNKQRMDKLKEELMAAVWHPNRIQKWIECDFDFA